MDEYTAESFRQTLTIGALPSFKLVDAWRGFAYDAWLRGIDWQTFVADTNTYTPLVGYKRGLVSPVNLSSDLARAHG